MCSHLPRSRYGAFFRPSNVDPGYNRQTPGPRESKDSEDSRPAAVLSKPIDTSCVSVYDLCEKEKKTVPKAEFERTEEQKVMTCMTPGMIWWAWRCSRVVSLMLEANRLHGSSEPQGLDMQATLPYLLAIDCSVADFFGMHRSVELWRSMSTGPGRYVY